MSRADFEDAIVDEIDGQPRAYMELSDGDYTVRFVYRLLVYLTDTKDEAQAALDDAMAGITLALKKLGGGLIIWRVRPSVEKDADFEADTKYWRGRARLATSPPLTDEVWQLVTAMQPPGNDIFQAPLPVDLRKRVAA